jgi:hypothetical protein
VVTAPGRAARHAPLPKSTCKETQADGRPACWVVCENAFSSFFGKNIKSTFNTRSLDLTVRQRLIGGAARNKGLFSTCKRRLENLCSRIQDVVDDVDKPPCALYVKSQETKIRTSNTERTFVSAILPLSTADTLLSISCPPYNCVNAYRYVLVCRRCTCRSPIANASRRARRGVAAGRPATTCPWAATEMCYSSCRRC